MDAGTLARVAPPARSDAPDAANARPSAAADVHALYEANAGFVYRSLARLGVADGDLPDLTHEVFLVAHRRWADRRGSSSARTWLFGIALKLAAAYRRRASRRREALLERLPESADTEDEGRGASPEHRALAAEARERAMAILDTLPLEERVAFVMFEIDEVPCPMIAEELGWPLGTVYTRVRNARRRFEAAVQRARANERGWGR